MGQVSPLLLCGISLTCRRVEWGDAIVARFETESSGITIGLSGLLPTWLVMCDPGVFRLAFGITTAKDGAWWR
ncbi:hypothetical protein ASPWEDRAFT_46832 [Aspergillus wentii DTO 134E9]|uniref:Uncharacterized protein n=1 Tax=Aspergillus wentii DTO 134E9 TaxID=1073089 RepID=A0A1L9R3Z2_ASPWE|nr:uncharacterized protein ASPWEDRAFT_46832 [Aspergillus wentii DTO 134E9]OJJ29639.1 hypothetical protein ASPWEDRAFT_46832 [Aspergillus wentii DTO 134E9]